jgi:hypothetical protein
LACTITQAQEFAWQCLHSGIDRPTSGRRSRAIPAALGSGGRGSRRRGSSISGGRGRFLFPILIPIRHAQACGVNGFAFGNVCQHTMSYVSIRCSTSAYDVACDMALRDSMGAAGVAVISPRRACRLFWHGCSRLPKHVVLEGLKENKVTWTDITRDQSAACTVHAFARAPARAVRMRAERECTHAHARACMQARACVHVARGRRAQGKVAYM